MKVAALILLNVPPETIKTRLELRDGISPPLETIVQHIDREISQANKISKELGIPLFFTDSDDYIILSKIQNLIEQ